MVDYAAEGSKSDVAMLSLNIQADVSGVFNWNVKQLFMYLVAEYSTMKNVSPMGQIPLILRSST